MISAEFFEFVKHFGWGLDFSRKGGVGGLSFFGGGGIGLTFREGRAEGDCTRQENGEDGEGEEREGEGSTEVFFQDWDFL